MSDHILELTSENFDEKVINSSVPVLIDFWAEWCGPCKQLMPTIDKIAQDYKGKVTVAKVNVDNERDIAAQYNVRGIPNLIIFNAGQPQEQLVGNVPEKQITDILNNFI
jgi:thioredoxin 1|tara:strand:- start:125 stop:451 length:327 start_codon:yes stop_codon:yes gene_type:complete